MNLQRDDCLRSNMCHKHISIKNIQIQWLHVYPDYISQSSSLYFEQVIEQIAIIFIIYILFPENKMSYYNIMEIFQLYTQCK